jgi:hypothetical protein
MTTKLQREASAAVEAWCKFNKIKLIRKPSHVHPRSYVVGLAAPACMIVAECWADSEPQMKDFNRKHPLRTVHRFERSLKPGDWCITAYVCTDNWQECVAIKIGGGE